MKQFFIFLHILLIAHVVNGQIAESFKARELSKEGKGEEAFELLYSIRNTEAFKKDTLGMNLLGLMYSGGRGTIKDTEEGIIWLKRASESGSKQARLYLGLLYSMGEGVKKDYQIAFEYLLPSAEAGDVTSMVFIADMYATGGKNFPKNEKECLKWYRNAANKGDATALCQMAKFFEFGMMGLEIDKEEAAKLYEKAAKKGEEKGICNIGRCYLEGIGVKMDENTAFGWFSKVPENKEAQYYLGLMYRDGWGTHGSDKMEAQKWLKKSAKQGYSPAQTALDNMTSAPKVVEHSSNVGHTSVPSSAPKNDKMSIDEVVELLKSEAVSAGYRTMVKEGKVEGNSEYLFNLQSASAHQVILVLPNLTQNSTPKIVMQHKATDGRYDYHVSSDWSDVREIGGHSVVKITFTPKIEGFTTPFVAQISHDGYFMIIRKF